MAIGLDLRLLTPPAASAAIVSPDPSTRPRREHCRGRKRSASVRSRQPHRAAVITQDLFRDAVVRERNRAHRFAESCIFLLVQLNDDDGAEFTPLPDPVVRGVTAAVRDSDIVGWVKPGSIIGVVLSTIASEKAAVESFETRLRRELATCLDANVAGRVVIRRQFHSATPAGRADEAIASDPLIEDLCAAGARKTLGDGFKRALDVGFSLGLLIVLTPLLLVIAAVVKVSSRGPTLFKQVRIGQGGRPFTMLKFRTMHVNADHAVHQQFVTQFITKSGPLAAAPLNQVFKLVNDTRVTPIGRGLRKTSLDELPQLWNVLRGDMSLVGPRPPLEYEVEKYQPWHWRRVLEAKPGVTGLWQVTGRSRTTFDGMVRLDLRYVKTRSVWTDLKILLATPRAVVAGKGAC